MTEQEIIDSKEEINKLSQIEMASLWRFAPMGHPYFTDNSDNSDNSLFTHFQERFKSLGGMTPEISKELGWQEKEDK